MDPNDRLLLKRNLELAEENNKMLKSMRNSQRINTIMRVFYWIFIIGFGIWSLQMVQPYLKTLTDTYGAISNLSGSGSSSGSSNSLIDLLKKYGGGK